MDYWDTLDIGRPELNHSQGFFSEFIVFNYDEKKIMIFKIVCDLVLSFICELPIYFDRKNTFAARKRR